MLTPEDKDLLVKKGISEQQIAEQLACFEKGFPFLKLDAAASVEKGIMAPAENEMKNYLEAWYTYKEGEKTIVKFVPASGAASRMFKNLFEFLGADYNTPKTDFEKKFFDHIHSFAFYNDLNAACMDNTGKDIDALMAGKEYKPIVANLLEAAGLNYGALPKGLLKFHRYADGVRTPLEEHLVEGWWKRRLPFMQRNTGWNMMCRFLNRSRVRIRLLPIWRTNLSAIKASCCSVRGGTAR